jgi:hypothetical protein
MTEQELRQKVVDTAKSMIGLKQANGSYEVIIDTYNSHAPFARNYKVKKYTDPWCATFVSAVGIMCNLTDIMFTECSCAYMINLYKAAGRWEENDAYVPKVADIVQYDWQDNGVGDNKGTPDHVGIVVAVDGNTLTIVEGNLNYAVATRKLSVNGRYIRGYCCPDYSAMADEEHDTYTVSAIGVFNSAEAAKSALDYIVGLGFKGNVTRSEDSYNEPEPIKPEPTKTVDELAREVILGLHGRGHDNRRASLEAKGYYNYDAVRARVNELLT